jgi:lipoprotein-anchoring transpeptidase ErfK/SrfK
VRRVLSIPALVLALVAAAPAHAQAPPPEPTIAAGVTIGGLDVEDLTAEQAHDAVEAAFKAPLQLTFGKRAWSIRPVKLNARAAIDIAVTHALAAAPDTAVALDVKVKPRRIDRYVRYLEKIFHRDAKDARILLRRLAPQIVPERKGVDVRPVRMANAIKRALRQHDRGPLELIVRYREPAFTRADIGPTIVIHRGARRLYLYKKEKLLRIFKIAVGQSAYPTPLGRYRVIVKERNPQWDPPSSPWAEGLGPIPPGPGNPLGTRWIGTSAPAIGIHGTPQPWTVGTAASHGCIRMYMSDVEWLFERIRVGTPVFIVSA